MSQLNTSSTIPLHFDHHNEHHIRTDRATVPQSPKKDDISDESSKSSILHCMIAGGFGGMVGDSSMHSLDTVKTRQQGYPNNPTYKHMIPAYKSILKNEGFFRGLYGGYTPAIIGSFPSTAAFFGTYEYSKRKMLNIGINDTIAYFVAGLLGDLASTFFYVPSEVLKTRLQLQGRYNNPYTKGCAYNYKGLIDAVRSIIRVEGFKTFSFGYKETLFRDLPFSALQLTFYERFRQLAIYYNNSKDLPISIELATGAAAGGLAGTLTTPLDVIKTRIQTATHTKASMNQNITMNPITKFLFRSSTLKALVSIYKTEGIIGAFSGVGPRCIWTGIQSSIMLLLYQVSLKSLDEYFDEGLQ